MPDAVFIQWRATRRIVSRSLGLLACSAQRQQSDAKFRISAVLNLTADDSSTGTLRKQLQSTKRRGAGLFKIEH
jgi:hypothetical protein